MPIANRSSLNSNADPRVYLRTTNEKVEVPYRNRASRATLTKLSVNKPKLLTNVRNSYLVTVFGSRKSINRFPSWSRLAVFRRSRSWYAHTPRWWRVSVRKRSGILVEKATIPPGRLAQRVWLPQRKILSTNWSTTRPAIEGSPNLSYSLSRAVSPRLRYNTPSSCDLLTRNDSYLITISSSFRWNYRSSQGKVTTRKDVRSVASPTLACESLSLAYRLPPCSFFFPPFLVRLSDGGYRRLPARSYRLIRGSSKMPDGFYGEETILCTV